MWESSPHLAAYIRKNDERIWTGCFQPHGLIALHLHKGLCLWLASVLPDTCNMFRRPETYLPTMASFSRGHPNKARPTKNPQFLKARSAMLPHWMLKRMNVVSFVTSERNLLSRPHPKLASSEQALTRHKLHKYCFAIWLHLVSFVYTGFSFLSSKLLEDAEDTATAKHHKLPGCQDN